MKMKPLVLSFFFLFSSHPIIFVQFEANAKDEANRGLVGLSLILLAFRLFGRLEPKFATGPFRAQNGPFYTRKSLLFKGRCPIVARKVP